MDRAIRQCRLSILLELGSAPIKYCTESGSCTSFPMPLCQPKVCSRIVIVPHRPVNTALRRKNASSSPELKMLKEQKVGIVQEKSICKEEASAFWRSRQK
jgi:hypothetical protein